MLQFASHRQRRVTHSSFAAEVCALLEGKRAVKELAVVHALVHTGDEHTQARHRAGAQLSPLPVRSDAEGTAERAAEGGRGRFQDTAASSCC